MTLFTVAIFLGAFLLFLVQPMAAKMVLPRVGGAPAVWNACMLFFQAALLAGYAYAHALTTRLRPAHQVLVHAAVLIAPLAVLPLALPRSSEPAVSASPVWWLLATLAVMVGAPFFALATTGPLLQRWFSTTDHAKARDPYFLYAAGNVGSLGALVAYPFLVEPLFRLQGSTGPSQTKLFSVAYVAYVGLAALCGGIFWKRTTVASIEPSPPPVSIGWRRALSWVGLAFLPSSAVLGVTQYLPTEIAVSPLLWVLPLSIYLLTFVLTFSGRLRVPSGWWSRLLGVLSVVAVAVFWIFFRPHPALLLGLHPLLLFAIGMVCHGRLAADRPPPSRLTSFYLLVALGGVLGGVFNTLLAPMFFSTVVEYPLAVLAACLAMDGARRSWLVDLAVPAAAAAAVLGMPWVVAQVGWSDPLRVFVAQAVFPCALALLAFRRPAALAISLAVLFGGAHAQTRGKEVRVLTERTFFGVIRVTERKARFPVVDDRGRTSELSVAYRTLHHGSTRHGVQVLDSRWRRTATSYYHRSGPIGQVFSALDRDPRLDHVGVIGLGVGTLAAYGKPGRSFTFYEIDPGVIRIARDPRYFTFLTDSASSMEFVPGDGRLSVAKAPDGTFGLIVLDAFSSDAIPLHLLTREAAALYVEKLHAGGLLAFHLTNQSLRLEPVVEAIAAELKLVGLVQTNPVSSPEEALEAKDESTWALLARSPGDLAAFAGDPRWTPMVTDPAAPLRRRFLWTDDTANLLGVIRFD